MPPVRGRSCSSGYTQIRIWARRIYKFRDITGTADLSARPHDISLVPGQRTVSSFAGTAGQKVSALLTKIKPGRVAS